MFESELTTGELVKRATNIDYLYIPLPHSMVKEKNMIDISKKYIFSKEVEEVIEADNSDIQKASPSNKKIFVVHGRDDFAKLTVSNYIHELGLSPIILHQQSNNGNTIIEKIENNSDVGYAIILYTPCDIGSMKESKSQLNPRARQNVVFEHGYFIGKLGRKKVAALLQNGVEQPGDINGVVFIPFSIDDSEWKIELRKELVSAGFSLK
ncbi:hypothetical protein CIN_10010 [Commensalibacter intestini A911]|uniref:CD-NTase-associated protein 12/Pycsar effector protein TIR domain-containing protein n=1 Tax=Commensalibacter intestini A911 TaxID=1088868 RepID=G6F055_9PROT|nr:nucleotide-binding protein [Commensalibacter intestini]EHD14137.1 hypothetical protein CIN_10010 [Commensalibacter intestini A911]